MGWRLLCCLGWIGWACAQPLALVEHARAQIGVTTGYDAQYYSMDYPNGDVPQQTGVCSDVVIRAYRQAYQIDLQKQVHEDMRQHFAQYPALWGLKKPDKQIDHRRVPNLEAFFGRHATILPVSDRAEDYQAGDIVTQRLNGRLPHILIVSDQKTADGQRPLGIHNIGAGTQEQDILFQHPIIGHFRYTPKLP